MCIQEDKTYTIKKVKIMNNDNYIFDLYNDIYLFTHAPLFEDILKEEKGTVKNIEGDLSLYIAKQSRESGGLVLIDNNHHTLKLAKSYKIIESKEDMIEVLI